eukprot:CAMPEP_0174830086 /NCGR_PEP_ID=MMETSP1114-20130205/2333_1 /TAXON_ID=312471 /ORGANISM="Neobodo designis, Strain CCAP 1951/1" /LENGTH=150 /DNA_ID=CAMNT_0016063869 /DNA_START=29 /DNA_END=479 /DNA_ORIENTATION=-
MQRSLAASSTARRALLCSSAASSSLLATRAARRWAGDAAGSDIDADKRMDEVNMQFGEARELIADAKESVGTTDYSDDAEDAIQATKEALQMYRALLQDLEAAGRDADKTRIERENGQKMKQLEIELQTVLEHDDDQPVALGIHGAAHSG